MVSQSQSSVAQMPRPCDPPPERPADRVQVLRIRGERVERIQSIWYEEFLVHYPASLLPVPPLCHEPWGRRAWERHYRVWRDAVKLMVEEARDALLESI
jgi:hypothetical protein